ncbi:F-box protein SKIP1 [Tanacetum coccineum]|uniref:F-box protein SKIP1 n=1 Tax=Tanacetum coccineum TaxID=301880 RepID=A0ABQ5IS68_9ASTR
MKTVNFITINEPSKTEPQKADNENTAPSAVSGESSSSPKDDTPLELSQPPIPQENNQENTASSSYSRCGVGGGDGSGSGGGGSGCGGSGGEWHWWMVVVGDGTGEGGGWCPNLEVLAIKSSENVTNETGVNGDLGAGAIGKYMPQLLYLELKFSTLSDGGLAMIFEGCKKLEYLNLSWYKDLTCSRIPKSASKLKNLKNVIIGDTDYAPRFNVQGIVKRLVKTEKKFERIYSLPLVLDLEEMDIM